MFNTIVLFLLICRYEATLFGCSSAIIAFCLSMCLLEIVIPAYDNASIASVEAPIKSTKYDIASLKTVIFEFDYCKQDNIQMLIYDLAYLRICYFSRWMSCMIN